ncbi:VacJ family lipoprotein [Sphingomonas sp.]|uniref:MlaA family lipoprotein n=1 Tax=Sphingomonas sp. TaxID=28214 RepID=UPI002CCE02CD|nr:VacJ family lipoprotein [Sphingomonas sp.]HWK34918.1 VacJ family lipoprotein [Sphingomonas sp.]
MNPGLIPALTLLAAQAQAQAARPVDTLVQEQAWTPPPPVRRTLPASVAAPRHAPGDPLEHFNRRMFTLHQRADKAAFRPVAMGYKHVVPKPARSGLRNVFSNLREPVVFLSYLLQLKPGKAAETLGRFVINTGLGLGGLIDVAKEPRVNLPHRANGLGNTLAFYGVKPGPYLFLPFVGPTTLRDLVGGQGDGMVLPLAVGKPFDRLEYQIPRGVVVGLDARAEADDDLKALFSGAVDPYATLRSVYLQNRAGEIAQLKGAHADTGPDDMLDDPAGPTTPNAAELDDPLVDPAATAPEANDSLPDPTTAVPKPD